MLGLTVIPSVRSLVACERCITWHPCALWHVPLAPDLSLVQGHHLWISHAWGPRSRLLGQSKCPMGKHPWCVKRCENPRSPKPLMTPWYFDPRWSVPQLPTTCRLRLQHHAFFLQILAFFNIWGSKMDTATSAMVENMVYRVYAHPTTMWNSL